MDGQAIHQRLFNNSTQLTDKDFKDLFSNGNFSKNRALAQYKQVIPSLSYNFKAQTITIRGNKYNFTPCEFDMGGFSLIRRIENPNDGSYGDKWILRTWLPENSNDTNKIRFLRDTMIQVYLNIKQPSVAPSIKGLFKSGNHFYSLMEDGGNQSLNQYIKNNPQNVYDILSKVADKVKYLQEAKIIHGDLSYSNILVDDSDNPYIIDFGKSCVGNFCAGSTTIDNTSYDLQFLTATLIENEVTSIDFENYLKTPDKLPYDTASLLNNSNLNNSNYEPEAFKLMMEKMKNQGIPVSTVTSKTRGLNTL